MQTIQRNVLSKWKPSYKKHPGKRREKIWLHSLDPRSKKTNCLSNVDFDPKQLNTYPPGLLSNIFEECAVLDPHSWPSGVAYDSIYYLGDLSALHNSCLKRVIQATNRNDTGLSNPKSSKIPDFQWPEDIHSSKEDIHKYIYTVTGIDRYTAVRLLKMHRVDTYPSGALLNAMFGAAARFVECESVEPERKEDLPSDTIWGCPGRAIRMAQLLGLHRNCNNWEIPKNEKETWKRIWWALYNTSRFQTAILGRPVNLRDEVSNDNNVLYPDSGADIEEVVDAYEAD
ncbi:hypothetical protein [Parasitella parasitica]|uniref:Xylanolytic transcriptional activator regulatory domain-containing protein n=1 Tax=Parasitella parasitica TaxID=35722 RepID=A0A0B7MYT0_9FUNG|nr:hypothetical protein [Parasitella parasitica]